MKSFFYLIALFFTFVTTSKAQNDFSLLFDGVNDIVEIPINTNFDNVTDSFTICAWVKPLSIGTTSEGSAIIARRDYISGIERTHFQFGVTSDLALKFTTQDGSILGGNFLNALSSDSVINYGDWNFVSVVFYKGLVKLFSNGNLVYNNDFGNFQLSPLSHLISIGRIHRTVNNTYFAEFGGMIDELSIWDDSLSSTEINQYMTCPPSGQESNLLAYWKFEEGINTTLNDVTGKGNNGTLMNGPQWFNDVPTKYCVCDSNLFPTHNIMVCDSVTLYGKKYYLSQTVTDTILGLLNCDSIITTHITVNNAVYSTVDTTIEYGTTYYTGGSIQTSDGTYIDTYTNYKGCDSIVEVNLSVLPQGINEISTNYFNFYPNPTTGLLTVMNTFEATILIFSIEGKLLINKNMNPGLNVLNLYELEIGTYLIKHQSVKGVTTSILVKK